jgi:hypothetical protein
MEQTINRWQVVQQMDSGMPFDLSFITCDRRRGTGGEIRRVTNYVKYKGETISARTRNRQLQTKLNSPVRNPNHLQHKTVNIYNPHDSRQHPYTVHWRLMVLFNGKRIVQ